MITATPYLHEPLVVERDPDGEGVEDKDQDYSAESPTDDEDSAYHPELVLTSRQTYWKETVKGNLINSKTRWSANSMLYKCMKQNTVHLYSIHWHDFDIVFMPWEEILWEVSTHILGAAGIHIPQHRASSWGLSTLLKGTSAKDAGGTESCSFTTLTHTFSCCSRKSNGWHFGLEVTSETFRHDWPSYAVCPKNPKIHYILLGFKNAFDKKIMKSFLWLKP